MNVLDRINSTGTTIVMATHDVALVDEIRRRVIELEDGKIIRDEAGGTYVTTSIPVIRVDDEPIASFERPADQPVVVVDTGGADATVTVTTVVEATIEPATEPEVIDLTGPADDVVHEPIAPVDVEQADIEQANVEQVDVAPATEHILVAPIDPDEVVTEVEAESQTVPGPDLEAAAGDHVDSESGSESDQPKSRRELRELRARLLQKDEERRLADEASAQHVATHDVSAPAVAAQDASTQDEVVFETAAGEVVPAESGAVDLDNEPGDTEPVADEQVDAADGGDETAEPSRRRGFFRRRR